MDVGRYLRQELVKLELESVPDPLREDAENAFTFEITPLFGILPGDFNEDGTVIDFEGDYEAFVEQHGH